MENRILDLSIVPKEYFEFKKMNDFFSALNVDEKILYVRDLASIINKFSKKFDIRETLVLNKNLGDFLMTMNPVVRWIDNIQVNYPVLYSQNEIFFKVIDFFYNGYISFQSDVRRIFPYISRS